MGKPLQGRSVVFDRRPVCCKLEQTDEQVEAELVKGRAVQTARRGCRDEVPLSGVWAVASSQKKLSFSVLKLLIKFTTLYY